MAAKYLAMLTLMVTVKLHRECLLEMSEAAYDSEILFQHMIGAVSRHHINYSFSHNKGFPHKKKHKDYTNHQPKNKKSLCSEKETTVSNDEKFTGEFYFTLDERFG